MAWAKDSRQDLYVELAPGLSLHDSLLLSRRINLPPVATNRVYFSPAIPPTLPYQTTLDHLYGF